MPEFDGLNVDPLKDLKGGGRGGYRAPVGQSKYKPGSFLGKGDKGLKLYQDALEEVVKQSGKASTLSKIKAATPAVAKVAGKAAAIGLKRLGPLGLIAKAPDNYPKTIWDGIGDGSTSSGPDKYINKSRSASRGNCPYINSIAADGSKCGRRAASVRGPTRGYDPPARRRPAYAPCPTMSNVCRDGSRCGRRAASVRGPTRGYDGI